MDHVTSVNDYWEECRGLYAPFESGQKSGSADVYNHEMPGGQYTNLLFQSQQLGLTGRWPAIKRAYARYTYHALHGIKLVVVCVVVRFIVVWLVCLIARIVGVCMACKCASSAPL
jgi:pyruvate carboxylase